MKGDPVMYPSEERKYRIVKVRREYDSGHEQGADVLRIVGGCVGVLAVTIALSAVSTALAVVVAILGMGGLLVGLLLLLAGSQGEVQHESTLREQSDSWPEDFEKF
jgi:hypothetical protein